MAGINESSKFVKHEPCPECRRHNRDKKGNNLGVWTDHKYCFSCSYYEGNSPIERWRQISKQEFHSVELKETALPDDTTHLLRPDALRWIKSYGITSDEMFEHDISWSEREELLIFPFYGGNMKDLVAWQGRYFGVDPRYPKYVTYGIRQNLFHFVMSELKPMSQVVLVEDVISSIKVGRVATSMPLFCSDANKYQLHRVSLMFDKVVIWLDPDKRNHAIKLGQRAESFFKTVRVVFTEDDPKCYSTEAIQELLHV